MSEVTSKKRSTERLKYIAKALDAKHSLRVRQQALNCALAAQEYLEGVRAMNESPESESAKFNANYQFVGLKAAVRQFEQAVSMASETDESIVSPAPSDGAEGAQ